MCESNWQSSRRTSPDLVTSEEFLDPADMISSPSNQILKSHASRLDPMLTSNSKYKTYAQHNRFVGSLDILKAALENEPVEANEPKPHCQGHKMLLNEAQTSQLPICGITSNTSCEFAQLPLEHRGYCRREQDLINSEQKGEITTRYVYNDGSEQHNIW